jgi:acetylornithine deacetylase/succinyl-diaminopimelate desuccinylase-like protein
MITCFLRYVLDPGKTEDFAAYGRLWMPIVTRHGGQHHGYFLPHEGANNVGYALFSFPSLAAYEAYRLASASDPEAITAYAEGRRSGCIISYERSFLKPLLID